MDDLTELFQDFQLETRFGDDYVDHVYDECDAVSAKRVVKRTERWKRLRLLGYGGFGSVWLEKCIAGKQDGSLRATKDIRCPNGRIDYARELEALLRFSRASSARWFCQSFGWYEENNTIHLAMEYFPLGDLHTYSSKLSRPLPEGDVQQIILQVLEGLEYMHRKNIAHRDIKPSNILLQSCPPQSWWVKISDFGLSKRLHDSLMLSSVAKGTKAFMAPELQNFMSATVESPVSPKSADMWAVGAMTYLLSTTCRLFDSPYECSKYVQHPEQYLHERLALDFLSSMAIALIKALLRPKPSERLTATDALRHPWISMCADDMVSKTPLSSEESTSSDAVVKASQVSKIPSVDAVTPSNTKPSCMTSASVMLESAEASSSNTDTGPINRPHSTATDGTKHKSKYLFPIVTGQHRVIFTSKNPSRLPHPTLPSEMTQSLSYANRESFSTQSGSYTNKPRKRGNLYSYKGDVRHHIVRQQAFDKSTNVQYPYNDVPLQNREALASGQSGNGLTSTAEKDEETTFITDWRYGIHFMLTFSPYWKSPFYLKWNVSSPDSFWGTISARCPPDGAGVRKQIPTHLTVDGPFTMCPSSRLLAFVTTEREGAWSKERHVCVIFSTRTAKIIARMSPVIEDRKCQMIALSPNGRLVAFGCIAAVSYGLQVFSVIIRSALDGHLVDQYQVPTQGSSMTVKAMAFGSDSRRLALLCQEKEESDSIFLFVRKWKEAECNLYYYEFARQQSSFMVPGKHMGRYKLSPTLLFLPDESLIVTFYDEGTFEPASNGRFAGLGIGDTTIVETVSDQISDGPHVHPCGRLYAVRILRERWESDTEPVIIDWYGRR